MDDDVILTVATTAGTITAVKNTYTNPEEEPVASRVAVKKSRFSAIFILLPTVTVCYRLL